jgi:hypothetical protein
MNQSSTFTLVRILESGILLSKLGYTSPLQHTLSSVHNDSGDVMKRARKEKDRGDPCEREGKEEQEAIDSGDSEGYEEVYTELKAGYRLTIESWENDMNSPFTRVEEGCTKEQLEFLVNICRLFRFQSKFSNLETIDEKTTHELGEIIAELIDEFKPHSFEIVNKFRITEDLVANSLESKNYRMILEIFLGKMSRYYFGLGDSHYPHLTRVCERIKVEYIPVTIRILDISREYSF